MAVYAGELAMTWDMKTIGILVAGTLLAVKAKKGSLAKKPVIGTLILDATWSMSDLDKGESSLKHQEKCRRTHKKRSTKSESPQAA